MSDNVRSGQKIKMATIDELLGAVGSEGAEEIALDKIYGFENHPFKVLDDDKMAELVESIRVNGVLSPVLVRPDDEGGYEMISGHRRMHAAKLAGLTSIPAIVKEMTNDEATIAMVDANIQREEILPSERAFAFKMKFEALSHQGATLGHDGPKWSHEEIGDGNGMSGRQVKRYIRLTELIPELLEFVDNKRLQFVSAVDISYFPKDMQKWLYEYIRENGTPRPDQIAKLKEIVTQKSISQSEMIFILNGEPSGTITKKVTLPEKKLYKYFPPTYTVKQMEEVIFKLLEQWREEGDANGDV